MTPQPPKKPTTQFVLRSVGFTAGILLAISNIQFLVHVGVMIMGLTAVFTAERQPKIGFVPGLVLIVFCVSLMLFLVIINTRIHDDGTLMLMLRPWYVSVMVCGWGCFMFREYRKWRKNILKND